jgi:D-alanine-D-alanine ligase
MQGLRVTNDRNPVCYNFFMSTPLKVGVLRGGPSSEYEVSLKSGQTALASLSKRHHPLDIFIDREGVWHVHGLPKDPHKVLAHVDVIFNALHGEYGEDGTVQQLLEDHRIPYTGSGPLSSRIAMNKRLAKSFVTSPRVADEYGFSIKTPYFKSVKRESFGPEVIEELYHKTFLPAVIKPVLAGSSIGVSIVHDYRDVPSALERALDISDEAIIEEYIKGKEATVGVIDAFRGLPTYSLMPVEIRPKAAFFDYNAKYGNETEELCPGSFTKDESATLQKLASAVHAVLGLRHYSRSDFIVHPTRGVYFLEANTLPGMTASSLFPKALQAVGCSLEDFLDHVLFLALKK